MTLQDWQQILPDTLLLAERFLKLPKDKNITFSTSFGVEDQIITHYLAQTQANVRIFTLDTGRLFPQTYDVWHKTQKRYNIHIQPYYPNQIKLNEFINQHGMNGFYDSPENRHSCCQARKIMPLTQALKGTELWIVGLRAQQSNFRSSLPMLQNDTQFQTVKFAPLYDLTDEAMWTLIHQHNIPYNPLHDQGFVSIGCAPCTRAIKPGEDPRAGRWWWEQDDKRECGLHFENGKLVRPKKNDG